MQSSLFYEICRYFGERSLFNYLLATFATCTFIMFADMSLHTKSVNGLIVNLTKIRLIYTVLLI